MRLTTQQILEIVDIKDGVLIMKDKSLRGILLVSSLNFSLKSEEEQQAIVYQFQNFLNSLDFPIQIYIQSRRLNITGYLEKLKSLENQHQNPLLKIQMRDYIKFIQNLLAKGSIMTKSFYVVVPFHPGGTEHIKKTTTTPLTEEEFQRNRIQLLQRLDFVSKGLAQCGLTVVPLDTSALIEFFWAIYHPEESEFGYFPEIPPELIK